MSQVIPAEQLIQRVGQGDEDALIALYQQFGRAVYSVAFFMVKDPATAEEITQDVFVTLWLKSDRFNPQRGRFETWLMQVTRNQAIDRLRQQRRQGLPALSLETDSTHSTLTATMPSSTNDLSDHLPSLLKNLPAEQRQVIELAYFQGYTHTEIARRLRLPTGTVKSRILLGLRKLRAYLKNSESQPSQQGSTAT